MTEKQIEKMEKELIKKYTKEVIIEYKEKYDEAETLIILGSEVEDKKGLKQAEKEYYNEAEEMLAEIPEDYKQFRELLAELY